MKTKNIKNTNVTTIRPVKVINKNNKSTDKTIVNKPRKSKFC